MFQISLNYLDQSNSSIIQITCLTYISGRENLLCKKWFSFNDNSINVWLELLHDDPIHDF